MKENKSVDEAISALQVLGYNRREIEKALEKNIPVHYVANRNIPFGKESDLFTMHICAAKDGEADTFLLEHCTKNDVVITRDIPLAKQLFEKGIRVLNDRGTLFNSATLEHLLEERALSLQLQELGLGKTKRKKTFGKKEAALFAQCLNTVLENAN